MDSSFEESLIDVWRQALVENVKVVALGKERIPVRQIEAPIAAGGFHVRQEHNSGA